LPEHPGGDSDALAKLAAPATVGEHAQELFQAAETAWNARQWPQAAAGYRTFLDWYPSHSLAPRAHLRLGTYLSFDVEPEVSMARYERAIAMAPGSRVALEATLGLAAVHYAEGEYAKARERLCEVLAERSAGGEGTVSAVCSIMRVIR
jgi:TolA-binding protein